MKPLVLPLLLLLAVSSLRADLITLKDGTTREGLIVAEDDKGVTLEMRAGTMRARITIPRAEVASVEKRALPEVAPAKTKPAEKTPEAKDTVVPPPAPEKGRLIQVGNGVWIQEADKDKLIAQELQKLHDAGNLVIAPRKDPPGGPLTPAEMERERMIEAALEKIRRSEAAKLTSGDSLLARWGYFAPPGAATYIGGAAPDGMVGPPVWYDGYGYVTPNTEFFAGYVGTGPYWGDRWNRWGGWNRGPHVGTGSNFYLGNNSANNFRRNFGYSPGFRWGQFSFGTNFGSGYGPYNGGYGGGGYNLNLSGGNKNFRYNITLGGGGGWGW